MVDIIPKIQALLLLPPGVIIVVALLGFLVQIRWLLAGSLIVFSSVAALLLLSLPLTGYQLMQDVESRYPPLRLTAAPAEPAPGAIVILGGGRYAGAREYGDNDVVHNVTLERLRYGAHLHRLTGLPILVSGGAPYAELTSEAELMQASLVNDFRVEVKWMENRSVNTYENARFTKKLLAEAGVRRVYLVTHASHMPRAVWSFENQGIGVIPAPTGFATLNKEVRDKLGYFPSASGLHQSSSALRERLGLFWYRQKYGKPETAPASAG